jgi:hypothetical protein
VLMESILGRNSRPIKDLPYSTRGKAHDLSLDAVTSHAVAAHRQEHRRFPGRSKSR